MKINLICLTVIFVVLIISNVSAICEENQININNASKEGLDELYGVGPVKSQEIIDFRPFSSVDDLIKVKGIGEITLNKIKEQGLACVAEKTETPSENTSEDENESKENNQDKEDNESIVINNTKIDKEQEEPPVIKLIPKDIKTEENNKNSGRSYAMLEFIVFCILLAFLFVLKKKKSKNEFN